MMKRRRSNAAGARTLIGWQHALEISVDAVHSADLCDDETRRVLQRE